MVEFSESKLAQMGLTVDFTLKEAKMNDLLSQWPILCAENRVSYALFGGTAINKAFLDQPRFSEDADFFVYQTTLPQINRMIHRLDGFDVSKPQRIFRELHRWTLSYQDASLDRRGQIQLDVNLNLSKERTPSERCVMHSFLEKFGLPIPAPRLNTLPKTTLLAMKLLAVQSRTEGKDYYDVYRLLSSAHFSKSAVLSEARNYSDSLFDFFRFDPAIIERAVASVKKADVVDLTPTDAYILKPYRPDWGALKKDVVRLLNTNLR